MCIKFKYSVFRQSQFLKHQSTKTDKKLLIIPKPECCCILPKLWSVAQARSDRRGAGQSDHWLLRPFLFSTNVPSQSLLNLDVQSGRIYRLYCPFKRTFQIHWMHPPSQSILLQYLPLSWYPGPAHYWASHSFKNYPSRVNKVASEINWMSSLERMPWAGRRQPGLLFAFCNLPSQ